MDILFFGRLGDTAQAMSIDCPAGVMDTDDLSVWLSKGNPALAAELAKPGNRIAVNQQLIIENTAVSEGDEIAFMSPLSGG